MPGKWISEGGRMDCSSAMVLDDMLSCKYLLCYCAVDEEFEGKGKAE